MTIDNGTLQEHLLEAEVVSLRVLTDAAPATWYGLKLGPDIIQLGDDKDYAEALCFSIRRAALAWQELHIRPLVGPPLPATDR